MTGIAPTRLTLFGLLSLAVWLAIFSILYWLGIAIAHAQGVPGPSVPDPVTAVDTVTKLWRSGAITGAIILGSFFALVMARSRIPWLQEGKRAAYVAAVIGVLGTFADAVNRGETPTLSMIMVSLAIAVALVTDPAKPLRSRAPTDPGVAPSEVKP